MKIKEAAIFVITEDESVKKFVFEESRGLAVPMFMASAAEAIEKAKALAPQVFIIDAELKANNGLEVLRWLKSAWPDAKIMMLTAVNSIPLAVAAAKQGADEFLKKPLQPDVFKKALKTILDNLQRVSYLALPNEPGFEWLGGTSAPIEKLFASAEIALQEFKDIILVAASGIDGVGFARVLHHNGRRAKRKLVVLDLLNFESDSQEANFWTLIKKLMTVKGDFDDEASLCGTVVLRNFDLLPYHYRHSILDFLRNKANRIGADQLDRNIKVILVVSSQDAVSAFDEAGLLEAFNVLRLPTLAERKNDLPLIFLAYIAKYNQVYNRTVKFIAANCLELLFYYPFSGNYSELEKIISASMLRCTGENFGIKELYLTLDGLKAIAIAELSANRNFNFNAAMRKFDALLVNCVLEKTDQSLAETARFLSLSKSLVQEKLD